MINLSAAKIRQMWLDFFASKGHSIEKSASLIPLNDPTLLWTNAGVAPLKKYFDGREIPLNPKMVNVQKCIRTNDIENVGKTARHHTFFEMLGNFSIGDYFKEEALEYAIELLTSEKWLGIPKELLYITYYPEDILTRDIWIKLGISQDHLIPLESNFWEIGEGPCGPDTEIWFDRGEKYDKRGPVLIAEDLENERFIEIWNIVFSMYNSKEGLKREEYKELPNKNIDTGCGLERLACIMQGAKTNYETDLFIPIIKQIADITNTKYTGQMSFKVIADHVRTVSFAVADGATFANEGRGYVLRRVLRRAVKHAKKLGIKGPFMARLVDTVVEIMEDFYPYLREKADRIKEMITKEEEKFLSTIASGEKRFAQIAQNTKDEISGEDAFTLYDTYGFPYELTVEYAEELGLKVNEEEFKEAMKQQKQRARNSRVNSSSMQLQNEAYLEFKEESEFIGYDNTECLATVIKVFPEGIILDKTPFYAFSGGQLADKGTIEDIEVIDVKKLPNGQHLHLMETKDFKEKMQVSAVIDVNNRNLIRKNHTSAHILQAALREILGPHVTQQGSQVSSEYVRFDFNNYEALNASQILEIEKKVNEIINAKIDVKTFVLPIEEAKKTNALSLFGEKYGSVVRVIDLDYSKELCGGTHVSNTKEIGSFAITSCETIASGVYRITAVTGPHYQELVINSTKNLDDELQAITNKANNIINTAKNEGIILDNKYEFDYNNTKGYAYILKKHEEIATKGRYLHELEKAYQAKKSQSVLSDLNQFDSLIKNKCLVTTTMENNIGLVKEMAIALLNNKNLDAVFLASASDIKVTFVIATSNVFDANAIIKEVCNITGGSGGGKKNLAQGGTQDVLNINKALDYVKGRLGQ